MKKKPEQYALAPVQRVESLTGTLWWKGHICTHFGRSLEPCFHCCIRCMLNSHSLLLSTGRPCLPFMFHKVNAETDTQASSACFIHVPNCQEYEGILLLGVAHLTSQAQSDSIPQTTEHKMKVSLQGAPTVSKVTNVLWTHFSWCYGQSTSSSSA